MFPHMIETAQKQFAKIDLFECCYVRGRKATYAVHDSNNGSFENPLFYRTVDILTGEIVDQGANYVGVDSDYVWCFDEALKSHYSPEYIREDGLVLMYEQLGEKDENKTHMHYHIVFGQSVHYQDIDELHVSLIDSDAKICIFKDGTSEMK